jgi:polyisoprenoid-binding protein YceI
MKKITILLLFICFTLSISAQVRKINVAKSTIVWTGKKITGEHSGSLQFKEGSLTYSKKKLSKGSFTVDMTTLNNTDQSGKDKAQLEGHLKSSDFFGTEEFKEATLVFKAIKPIAKGTYSIVGDLTIKGKTNPVIFDLKIKGNKATTSLIVDRTKYGIQYGSGSFFADLGDRTIYDEFELKIELVF